MQTSWRTNALPPFLAAVLLWGKIIIKFEKRWKNFYVPHIKLPSYNILWMYLKLSTDKTMQFLDGKKLCFSLVFSLKAMLITGF